MKILVIGGGGREHAIIMKLAESDRVTQLYCTPGNGGIAEYAECFNVKATDIDGVVALAKKLTPDYVFVAPDDPLVLGMVDRLQAEGFKTFGPKANAAILEGSKVFSKNLMKKYNIPTAMYETFDSSETAIKYIQDKNTYPIVIKADGLALGKGAVIAENYDNAKETIISIMDDKLFGDSGNNIVIEEFMTGPEVTVLCFTDGKTIVPMISSMDHKRALDNDKGLNTGGMGTIAPNPYFTQEVASRCMTEIFIPTIQAMNKEKRPFEGCLYMGLMLTPNGPKVIEYNARFGDPETQVVLPLLKTDMVDIMEAIYEHRLDSINIEWSEKKTACVIAASGGYPEKYQTGAEIYGLNEKGQLDGVTVYHAGTKKDGDKLLTAGGRVLGVTAVGDSLETALKIAYDGLGIINFDKMHYRKDIGKTALRKDG